MALNGTALKSLMVSNLQALGRETQHIDDAGLEAIANAVVTHILTSAVITIVAGQVVIQVSGGSGAPAVGVPNVGAETCLIT